MPRSSSVDAIEKFRFSVTVLNLAIDPVSLVENITGFLRAGFSEVTLPRQSTTAMEYRENNDSAHPQLIPGITRYDPVTLRRGVTKSSDFARWAQETHNSNIIVSTAIERIKGDPNDAPPSESLNFRRDVLISAYDRTGSVAKAWILRNAWVSSYKPGDDLSASQDGAKLIEELEIRYESFEEITAEALISGSASDALGAFNIKDLLDFRE